MVQVLPSVATFGEKLVDTLSSAVGNIAQGFSQRHQNQIASGAMSVLQDPSKSPMQKVSAFMQLPENLKKSSAPIWAAILGPQAQAESQNTVLNKFIDQQFGSSQESQQSPTDIASQSTGMQNIPNQQEQTTLANTKGNPSQIVTAQNNPEKVLKENPADISSWDSNKVRRLASLGGPAGDFAKLELDRRRDEQKQKTAKETEIFRKNEPELIKLGDEIKDLEIEDSRLERLQNLYSDSSKFPPPWLASILSKEGQINPLAASQLSPEAQEAIKLTIDSLSGAQSTFGGKVSNFEAATYLKRNATLMNTPEGRERILHDLRAINKMNRNYAEGISDIIDRKGGSDKISFSSAERLWRKENKKEIEDLREQLVNPSKDTFDGLPDSSKFKGRKVKNETTGEVFISDGTSWKPFKG